MRTFILQFINPEYHEGLNLTVRKGNKWYNQAPVGSKVVMVKTGCDEAEIEGIITGTRKLPFLAINEHELYLEHDSTCRDIDGLMTAMKRAYPSFLESDEVTMLFFWIESSLGG